MITDKLENIHLYTGLNNRIKKALEYISTTDFSSVATGKYEIDGDKIFALVSEYETKDAATTKPEAHIKYIDVQYIVSGIELIGYTPVKNQKPVIDYNPEKDIMFFNAPVSFFKLEKGMFAIFFPNELHQPCIKEGNPSLVKKVVVKVMIQELTS